MVAKKQLFILNLCLKLMICICIILFLLMMKDFRIKFSQKKTTTSTLAYERVITRNYYIILSLFSSKDSIQKVALNL